MMKCYKLNTTNKITIKVIMSPVPAMSSLSRCKKLLQAARMTKGIKSAINQNNIFPYNNTNELFIKNKEYNKRLHMIT